MVEASATGLFRMLLILIGVFVILRFLGQVFVAKNNLSRQQQMKQKEDAMAKEKERARQNEGRIKIMREKQSSKSNDGIVDVDYEDVED